MLKTGPISLPNKMKDQIKNLVFKPPFMYNLWAAYKSREQELYMRREQSGYEETAETTGLEIIRDRGRLSGALKDRLIKRGIRVGPKKKGELHIVFAVAPSTWEKHNICAELSKFGKLTNFFLDEQGFPDYNSPGWIKTRRQAEVSFLQFIKRLHSQSPVDLVFSGFSGWHISPQAIAEINGLGMITCAYCWDDKLGFKGSYTGGRYSGVVDVAKAYDLNLTNAPVSLVKYFVEGALAMFWPEAANPDFFRPLNLPFEYDVSFVGACYGQRPLLIEYLKKNGINVKAFGPGWPQSSFISNDKMVEIAAKSRVNLGFGGIGYSGKEMCLKSRDFELPMCGALYLTTYHKDLDLVYDLNEEIVTYAGKEDCVKKIKWLLGHPQSCQQIRKCARARCLKSHTWEERFTDLLTVLNLMG